MLNSKSHLIVSLLFEFIVQWVVWIQYSSLYYALGISPFSLQDCVYFIIWTDISVWMEWSADWVMLLEIEAIIWNPITGS